MTEEQRWPEPVYLTKDHAINMTLRDYFAAKAMQAIMTAGYWNWKEPGEDSARCYAMADAMIKAREQ
jgi:hypothetical protein